MIIMWAAAEVSVPGLELARTDEAAVVVAMQLAAVSARIPPVPAAELGRSGVPEDEWPGSEGVAGSRRARLAQWRRTVPTTRPTPSAPAVLQYLHELPNLMVERLFGALELTIDELTRSVSGGMMLSRAARPTRDPAPNAGPAGVVLVAGTSEAVNAAIVLGQRQPDLVRAAEELTELLAGHPVVRLVLQTVTTGGDEEQIAVAHGRAQVALALLATHLVVVSAGVGVPDNRPAAVVGTGLAIAAQRLGVVAMPDRYFPALLERRRAEYQFGRGINGPVPSAGHRFALLETPRPFPHPSFQENGLVAVIDGGLVVRTGSADSVRVKVLVRPEPPAEVDRNWPDVVEVGWSAPAGAASLVGGDGTPVAWGRRLTPPWPGDYRIRVHAGGRDDQEENVLLLIWPAPAGRASSPR